MRSFTPFTDDAEIEAIFAGLADRTLPKPGWTHAAHFAAALYVLARRPDMDAAQTMPGLIRAYNEATGVANTQTAGYHETITLGSLLAARGFLAADQPGPLHAICNALLRSPLGQADWMLAYWTRKSLFSRQARAAWVEPDIAPLPDM